MSAHVGIDFGTTTTVIAVVDPLDGSTTSVALGEVSSSADHDGHRANYIPSLIHYGPSGPPLIGRTVIDRNTVHQPATFRWMKPTIIEHLYDAPRSVASDRRVTQRQAAEEFLGLVLARLRAGGYQDAKLCFTVPVHGFEDYTVMLDAVASKAGHRQVMFIDEASAAATGYDAQMRPGDSFLLFDFGGGTLDVAIVQLQRSEPGNPKRVRVLGKAGAAIGGRNIDGWIVEWTTRELGLDDKTRTNLVNEFLVSAERAKEALSRHDTSHLDAMDPRTGRAFTQQITAGQLEKILDDNRLFDRIEDTIRVALNQAREQGIHESDLKCVLLVGGSSLLPSVRKHLSRRFGTERVRLDRPIDAVARGAAQIAAGAEVDNCLYHRYELRYTENGQEKFDVIFNAGDAYPTRGWPWHETLTATAPAQSTFHLAFYETDPYRIAAAGCEITFSDTGIAMLSSRTEQAGVVRRPIHLEPITATASRQQGEACLDVQLRIDESRRLRIHVSDTRTNRTIHDDIPVVRLK